MVICYLKTRPKYYFGACMYHAHELFDLLFFIFPILLAKQCKLVSFSNNCVTQLTSVGFFQH